MPRKQSLIPADIMGRQRQQSEQAAREHNQAEDARKSRYQLVRAEDCAAHLGQAYEFDRKADEAYLKTWVEAMAGHKALLPAWPNPDAPPKGISEDEHQARLVAISIFRAVDTAPAKAVQALAELAGTVPGFAASVSRWLRRELWRDVEGSRPAPTVPTPAPAAGGNEVDPVIAAVIAKLERLLREYENAAGAGGNVNVALDDEGERVLGVLAGEPRRRFSIRAIRTKLKRTVSEKTIGERLRSLVDAGLAERNSGKKRGTAITEAGKAFYQDMRQGRIPTA
jgi:hypothetical protein